MISEIKKIINIDGIIIGLCLVLEVCYSKALVFTLPLLLIRCLIGYKGKKILINNNTIWLLTIFSLTIIFGLKLHNNEESFSVIYNIVTFLTVILIQIIFYQNRQNLYDIIKSFTFFASVFAGIYIILKEYKMILFRWHDFLIGNSGYRLGISSGINPNAITWTFGMLALFAIFFAIKDKSLKYYLIYFFNLVIIIFTGSKNGVLLALLPLFPIGVREIKKMKIGRVVLIITFLIILWICVHKIPFLYTLIGRRIDSTIYTLFEINTSTNSSITIDSASTGKRIDMMNSGLDMFWQKPLLGWGIGAFAMFAGFGYYCHNNYVEILVSGGIFLFIIYYGYIINKSLKFFIIKNKLKNDRKELAIILLLSIILLDFSTVNFYSDVIFYIRTALLFELIAYNNLQSKEEG